MTLEQVKVGGRIREPVVRHVFRRPGNGEQHDCIARQAEALLGLLSGKRSLDRIERGRQQEKSLWRDATPLATQFEAGTPQIHNGVDQRSAEPKGVVSVVHQHDRRPLARPGQCQKRHRVLRLQMQYDQVCIMCESSDPRRARQQAGALVANLLDPASGPGYDLLELRRRRLGGPLAHGH